MNGLLSLAALAFAAAITPGPNNAAILAVGSRAGVRGSLSGIAVIAASLLIMILGFGHLMQSLPATFTAFLEVLSGLLLAGMGLNTLRGRSETSLRYGSQASSLRKLAVLQVLNPKGWLFAGVVAAAAKSEGTPAWLAGAVAASVSSMCLAAWAGGGSLLGKANSSRSAALAIRWTVATLLLAIGLLMISHGVESLT